MEDQSQQQLSPELLAQFAAGDPFAEDAVLRVVLPQLYRWALVSYPNLPQSDVQSVIHQVVTETCRPKVRYNPAGAQLTTYLIGLIKLRLVDLYEKQLAISTAEETGPAAHEKLLHLPYNKIDTEGTATRITRDAFFQEAARRVGDIDRKFLDLIRQGEKRQEIFAGLLAQYAPVVDPVREVKNRKERLQRTLREIASSLGYRLEDFLDD